MKFVLNYVTSRRYFIISIRTNEFTKLLSTFYINRDTALTRERSLAVYYRRIGDP